MRVRGLKRPFRRCGTARQVSHPMRVRGLKPVTSLVRKRDNVAPHAGAWIETFASSRYFTMSRVAPHAGAWIETRTRPPSRLRRTSHPMRVRGLKHSEYRAYRLCFLSHPMRVRGLKQVALRREGLGDQSHPMRVRGLKLMSVMMLCPYNVSHPMRVRGLKQQSIGAIAWPP